MSINLRFHFEFLKVRNMEKTPRKQTAVDRMSSRHRAAARQAVLLDVPAVQVVSSATVIGNQVRAHRHKQSLRIDDAAALSGVSVDLMSRLENGASSIRLDKLMSVLDGLGLMLLVAPKGHAYLRKLPLDRVLPQASSQEPAAGKADTTLGAML